MTKLSTSDPTRNEEESGYETDSEKEIQPDSETIFTAQEPTLIGLGAALLCSWPARRNAYVQVDVSCSGSGILYASSRSLAI